MAAINMHAIMPIFLLVVSISSTIVQNKPESDYYDHVENPNFYQENPQDKWYFHRTSSTTSTYEKSESSTQKNTREKRGIVGSCSKDLPCESKQEVCFQYHRLGQRQQHQGAL